MELFKTIDELLTAVGQSVIIVVQKRPNDVVSVMVHYDDKNKEVASKVNLPPLSFRGTAQELDEHFIDSIKEPLAEAAGITSSISSFEKAKQALLEEEKKAKAGLEAEQKKAKAASASASTAEAGAAKKGKKKNANTENAPAPAEQDGGDNLFEGNESAHQPSESKDEVQQNTPSEETTQQDAGAAAPVENQPQEETKPSEAADEQTDTTTSTPEEPAHQEEEKPETFNELYAKLKLVWKADWQACIPLINKMLEMDVNDDVRGKLKTYLEIATKNSSK